MELDDVLQEIEKQGIANGDTVLMLYEIPMRAGRGSYQRIKRKIIIGVYEAQQKGYKVYPTTEIIEIGNLKNNIDGDIDFNPLNKRDIPISIRRIRRREEVQDFTKGSK